MSRNGRVKMAADHNGPTGFRLAHELEGLLRGISADGTIDSSETERLRRWLAQNDEYRNVIPFAELHRQVERALADGTLTVEEVEDLLFVVSKLTTVNPYFDQLRGGIQVLMGVLAGIAADQKLEDSEADALLEWADDWMHLRGLWPYDEIEAIVTTIVARNRVAEHGRRLLMLAEEFPVAGLTERCQDATVPLSISGVCTVDPTIVFEDRGFAFSGESRKCIRCELEGHVLRRGGRVLKSITKDIDFLVVCDEGNELWAFACYGRKVERAYMMRREGHRVQIVAERDFWDAIHV